jgi:hypothetical protein
MKTLVSIVVLNIHTPPKNIKILNSSENQNCNQMKEPITLETYNMNNELEVIDASQYYTIFDDLNSKINEIVKHKINIANHYFAKEYPIFTIGNIIWTKHKGFIKIEKCNIVYDRYRHNDFINDDDYHYRNVPNNRIEKEFMFDVIFRRIQISGLSKKTQWTCINQDSKNDFKFVFNINDFKSLTKKYHIKGTLNHQTVNDLYNCILKNIKLIT